MTLLQMLMLFALLDTNFAADYDDAADADAASADADAVDAAADAVATDAAETDDNSCRH